MPVLEADELRPVALSVAGPGKISSGAVANEQRDPLVPTLDCSDIACVCIYLVGRYTYSAG
jgi:hypothetical protein